jgi:cytochrome bd ubiquinol oxidase subunit II
LSRPGVWPNLIAPDLSIWDAAAPPSTQGFVLAGALIMLPAVLGYTWWSYSVFRGKVAANGGYHCSTRTQLAPHS